MSSPSLRIELQIAAPADIAGIVQLVNSAYRGESSQAGWTTEASILGGQRTDKDAIESMIMGHGQAILVYKEKGGIQACVYLKRQGSVAYLGMLTVSPTLQAGGIGRSVLGSAEQWAKTHWESQQIEMTVIDSRHELIAWYERRGYHSTNRREPFPNDPRFGIPLVEKLMFVVLQKFL